MARRSSIPHRILLAIGDDQDWIVAQAAMQNPLYWEARKLSLAEQCPGVDSDLIKRGSLSILDDPGCTPDVISVVLRIHGLHGVEKWGTDGYDRLASDPRTPDEILRRIADHGPRSARTIARERIATE